MPIALLLIVAVILAYIIYKWPIVGLFLAILIATTGELGRLPETIGLNYPLNDLFIPFFVMIWVFKKVSLDRKWKVPPLFPMITLWTIIAAFSLLINTTWLASNELIEGFLYLIRFIGYFFLYLIAYDEIKKNNNSWEKILYGLIGGAILIAIFGFIQLKIYPSFFELDMQDYGWDPHIGRLLSTWFDPNFVGGFLAFITCILFGIAIFDYKNLLKKLPKLAGFSIIFAIIVAALYLTYSRSAYLACGIGLLVITGMKSRKMLLLALIVLGIAAIGLAQIQARFLDLWESFQSIMDFDNFSSLFNPDATSRLRVESWQDAVAVIKEHPWFGSGYNTFKYAQWHMGLVQDIEAHATTGSDSTLLTIFATTGVFGFIAYIWFYIKAIVDSIKNAVHKKSLDLHQSYNLGLAGGLIALLLHSTFVNTLLFPHVLVFFWIALALSAKITTTES